MPCSGVLNLPVPTRTSCRQGVQLLSPGREYGCFNQGIVSTRGRGLRQGLQLCPSQCSPQPLCAATPGRQAARRPWWGCAHSPGGRTRCRSRCRRGGGQHGLMRGSSKASKRCGLLCTGEAVRVTAGRASNSMGGGWRVQSSSHRVQMRASPPHRPATIGACLSHRQMNSLMSPAIASTHH